MNRERVQRLLAVNLNYMGDGLFTTPSLAALRARFPEAAIDVLAGERAAAILRGNPHIDRLITRPPRGGAGRSANLWRTLKDGNYDAVLLFQSTIANAALAALAQVPVRVGFDQDGCGPFLTHRVPERRPGEHVVDAYLRLAEAIGEGKANGAEYPLSIAISPEEEAFAENFFGVWADRPTVGLVIGATRAQKRWPETYFARLADKIWDAAGVGCVLLGGPEEAEAARRIQAEAKSPLVSAVGKTTEKELAAVVGRLKVVVSGDSGPLHIAAAMKTPVVALFGSTDPAETGPWPLQSDGGSDSPSPRRNARKNPTDRKSAAPATVLYDALHCAPCRKRPTCGGRFDCMNALTPERVYDAVCDFLGVEHQRLRLPMLPASPVVAPVVRSGLPEIRRVCVIRFGAMGDILMTTPAVRAIAEQLQPDAIDYIVGRNNVEVLCGIPYLRRVIPYGPRGEDMRPHNLASFLKSLRAEKYDLCINFQPSLKTFIMMHGSGATRRITYDKDMSLQPETGRVRHFIQDFAKELRSVGVTLQDPTMDFVVPDATRTQVAALLAAEGIAPGTPFLAANPGGTRIINRWPPERYIEFLDRMAREMPALRLVLTGGPDDRERAEFIAANVRPETQLVNLANRLKIKEMGALLCLARVFVTPDTGPMHIASALGTPMVVLSGAADPDRTGPMSRRDLVVINRELSCVPCRERYCRRGDIACMTQMPVDWVINAVQRRLSEEGFGIRNSEFGPEAPSPTPDARRPKAEFGQGEGRGDS